MNSGMALGVVMVLKARGKGSLMWLKRDETRREVMLAVELYGVIAVGGL
jgi:hypothetical protein